MSSLKRRPVHFLWCSVFKDIITYKLARFCPQLVAEWVKRRTRGGIQASLWISYPWAWATGFSVFSKIQGKTVVKPFQALLLLGCTIGMITAALPMRPDRTCGRVRAQGPTPSAPKQWKSDVHVKSSNPVSAKSPLTKSKKKKIIESAAI